MNLTNIHIFGQYDNDSLANDIGLYFHSTIFEAKFVARQTKSLKKYLNALLVHRKTALIELSTPVTISASVKPAKLPSDCGENIDKGIGVVAVGAGMTTINKSNTFTVTLREVEMATMPYFGCRLDVDRRINIKSIICVHIVGGRSISYGDSGKLFSL